MNSILQWEPEKSKIWGSARIENVHRIRDDLARLADLIKIKADAASLTGKADAAKLTELEKAVGQTRTLLEGSKKESEKTCARLEQQLQALDQWVKSGQIDQQLQATCDSQLKTLDALGSQYHDCLEQLLASAREVKSTVDSSLEQCREIEKGFTQTETEARRFVTESLQTISEQLEQTSQNAEQSKSAAELIGALRLECEQLTDSVSKKSDALIRFWESSQATLTQLTSQSEKHALRAEEQAQAAGATLSECEATVGRAQQLRSIMETEQQESSQQLAAFLQQAEQQAAAAEQSSQLSAAASTLVGGLKAECESLTHSLRLKADELSATWEGVRQTLASLALNTQQHASKAVAAVDGVQQVLSDAEAHTRASQELRARLQAEQEQIGQRLNALDEMLEQVGSKVTASAEHVQACEKIQTAISDTDLKLKDLRQTLEEHLRQSKKSTEDVAAIRQELQQHITSNRLNQLTFGRRLRWLFFGNPAPKPLA